MDLPRIGKPAPNFQCKAVLDDKVFNLSLSDYSNKYVVLLFFPMDFAYVCPTELIAFSGNLKEFHEINAEIIACSSESDLAHLKWLSIPHKDGGIGGIRIPLIADKSMKIARQYGVLNEDGGFPYRATFIIDNNGILRHLSVNDRPVGRSVSETRRLIQTMQYADEMRESLPKFRFLEVSPTTVFHKSSIPSLHCIEKTYNHEFIE